MAAKAMGSVKSCYMCEIILSNYKQWEIIISITLVAVITPNV